MQVTNVRNSCLVYSYRHGWTTKVLSLSTKHTGDYSPIVHIVPTHMDIDHWSQKCWNTNALQAVFHTVHSWHQK